MLDDDKYLLFQYEDSLKDIGFDVDSSTDIRKFYSLATDNEYDAIVCDISLSANEFLSDLETMGGWTTGLAICKKIRWKKPSIKLIALTNCILPEVVEWFTLDESVAYCNKRYYPPLEFAITLKYILENPHCTFGELGESDTVLYNLYNSRNDIPNTQKEIIEKLDKIIEALTLNDNVSFKSNVENFISLFANISGILTSIPTFKDLITMFQSLLKL